MLHLLGISSLALYLAATVCFVIAVVRRSVKSARSGRWLFRAGFAAQSLSIIFLVFDIGFGRLDNSGDFYLWVSWAVAFSFLLFRSAFNFPIFGTFVAPLTALTMASSSYLVHRGTALPRDTSEYVFLGLHLFPALVAEAALCLACIVSIVFLMQDRRIKRKSIDSFNLTGPSLELLERLNGRCITVGFLAMTLAVMSGSVWGLGRNHGALFQDPYQWASVAVWFALGWIIHSRMNLRVSARRLSAMTVCVTGVFVVSLFIMMVFSGRLAHGSILAS